MTSTINDSPSVTLAPKRPWLNPIIYTVLVLAMLGVFAFVVFKPILVLPRITLAPGFALTNQNDELVTSEDMRGGLTLYSFTYADCTADGCPQTPAELSRVHAYMNEIAPPDVPVRLVTITVDPENDTAADLAALKAAHITADESRVPWQILTSDPVRVRQVVGNFGVYFRPKTADDGDEYIRFDPRFVLVDSVGTVRARYRYGQIKDDILARDINLVVEEMRNSNGLSTIGYEAAHLFVCYP